MPNAEYIYIAYRTCIMSYTVRLLTNTKRKVNKWMWIDDNEKCHSLFIYAILEKRNAKKMAMQNEKKEE